MQFNSSASYPVSLLGPINLMAGTFSLPRKLNFNYLSVDSISLLSALTSTKTKSLPQLQEARKKREEEKENNAGFWG